MRLSGRRISSIAITLAACVLVVALIRQIGPRVILEQCITLGGVLPLVLALTFLKYPLKASAWRLALPAAARPPLLPSLRATLTGDAIGYLTWAGPVTGEPLRALLLQPWLPMATGVAVGVLERALYVIGGALVIVAAFAIAAARLGHGAVSASLVAGALATIAAATLLLYRHRGRHDAADEATTPWRRVLAEVWADRPGAIAGMALLCLAQHVVLITEAYVMLRAMGAAPTFSTVLIFEGVTKTVNTIGAIVPGRLGIAEGGSAALAASLGLGASQGLSLALMRRVRAVIWGVVGAALSAPDAWRALRDAPPREARL
jgi:hypothetical protein